MENGVDAMLGNKSVSHFGTGNVGEISYDNGAFDKWITGTFTKHFRDTSIDNYIIDLRNFTKDQQDTVLSKIKEMGAETAKKVHVILGNK